MEHPLKSSWRSKDLLDKEMLYLLVYFTCWKDFSCLIKHVVHEGLRQRIEMGSNLPQLSYLFIARLE